MNDTRPACVVHRRDEPRGGEEVRGRDLDRNGRHHRAWNSHTHFSVACLSICSLLNSSYNRLKSEFRGLMALENRAGPTAKFLLLNGRSTTGVSIQARITQARCGLPYEYTARRPH